MIITKKYGSYVFLGEDNNRFRNLYDKDERTFDNIKRI